MRFYLGRRKRFERELFVHISQHKAKKMCYNNHTGSDGTRQIGRVDSARRAVSGKGGAQKSGNGPERKITMVKQINIQNFEQIKSILNEAVNCRDDIGVHDTRGSIADAKSILGLMSLDYSRPVTVVSENERELRRVCRAVN